MLKVVAFGLTLAYWLGLANAALVDEPPRCDERCREYIEKCGKECLDLEFCPNSFPPFRKECSVECQRYLTLCKEDCFTDTKCRCPGPRDLCPFTGAAFSNKDCCNNDENPCLSFYCPAAGSPWQCVRKCIPPPQECDKECYCPDLKEGKCPIAGMTIKNKACCKHNPSQGCSEFFCPTAGGQWECKDRCDCLCPNTRRRELCTLGGAYIRNKACCRLEGSDGCAAWYCPASGQPWQCQTRC